MANESYLQYLYRTLGKLPTNAGSLIHHASAYGSDLPYDQLYAAQQQTALPHRRKGGKFENGNWLDAQGNRIQPTGDTFNYGRLPGSPGNHGAKMGGQYFGSDVPPPPQTVPQVPVQRNPGTPDPGAGFTDGLVTQAPGGMPGQPPGPGPGGLPPPPTGNQPPPPPPPAANPQTGPMQSFNPTDMLMALRNVTNGGALAGPNQVQNNLGSWLSRSMQPAAR